MWENFSKHLQQILIGAQVESYKLGLDYIGSEHLMLGILNHRHNTACRELKKLDVNLSELERRILERAKRTTGKTRTNFSLSARTTRIIEIAYSIVHTLGHSIIGSEHILLGLLKEANGMAARILISEFGIDYRMMLEKIYGVRELKLENFMECREMVGKELEFLEENFHRSLIQNKVMEGKMEEILHLMDYVGDLFESINRHDLRDEILKIRNKVNSPGIDEDAADVSTVRGNNIIPLNVKSKELGSEKSRAGTEDNLKTRSGLTNKSKLNNMAAGDVDGISISINLDRKWLRNVISQSLKEILKAHPDIED